MHISFSICALQSHVRLLKKFDRLQTNIDISIKLVCVLSSLNKRIWMDGDE